MTSLCPYPNSTDRIVTCRTSLQGVVVRSRKRKESLFTPGLSYAGHIPVCHRPFLPLDPKS